MVEETRRGPKAPAGFTRQEFVVNGVRTVVYIGGRATEGQPPLVYWHGAGSWHGFDFAAGWLDRMQVIVPSHPGFGASDDPPPHMNSISDYVLHYLDLFDLMGLGKFNLLGLSMGGWMASEFAVSHSHRLHKLALVASAGLPDPQHPGPPGMGTWSLDEMYGYLVSDIASLKAHLPAAPEETHAHALLIKRELQSAGKLFAAGPFNPKLEHWLHRVTVPTLLVWSRADRLTPVGRTEKWMKVLPNAHLKLVEGAGHLTLDESAEAREAVLKFFS